MNNVCPGAAGITFSGYFFNRLGVRKAAHILGGGSPAVVSLKLRLYYSLVKKMFIKMNIFRQQS
jgi:hypothetical protein